MSGDGKARQARDRPASLGHCPYCHFALKAATTMHCPSCAAGHHPECWTENGGCAVMGCGELAAPIAPEPLPAPASAPSPPPAPAPSPAPAARDRSSRLLVIAAAIAAVAAAGAVAAVALTRGTDASPRAGSTPPPPATVTVFKPAADDPAADVAAPGSSTPAGRLVVGEHYSVRIPDGFTTKSLGVYHAATKPTENSYTESQWQSEDGVSTYIHIDYTTGFDGDVGDAARQVRADYHKGPAFREHSFSSVARDDGVTAWRWQYSDRLSTGVYVDKIDYFVAGCNTGYALLGVAPTSHWPRAEGVLDAAARSLTPRC